MELFATVDKTFESRRGSQRLARAFGLWRRRHRGLRPFADIHELIASFEVAGVPAGSEGDSALAALCAQAARGGRSGTADDDAACLLLWAVLQPLRRRAHDPDVARALDNDDVQAEIAAGLWEGVVGITPGRSGVAALLINAGRRRARQAARKEIDRRVHEQRLRDLPGTSAGDGDLEHPEQIVDLALHQEVVDEVEADLIASTRLGPEPLSYAASRHGIPYDTAKHRRARAEERLRTWAEANGAELAGFSVALGVSDLRDEKQQSSYTSDGKEVMPGPSDGLANRIPRRSDATKPSDASVDAHGRHW
jgi:DNA-directed RNA polymerase specialized sigma24 family protein